METNQNIYPDAVLNIERVPASVFQLKRRRDKTPPSILLQPEFQREFVWNPKQRSELIESILMGIPLPIIYVKEDIDGTYIIIDGQQRLNTLFDYIDNKFAITKIKVLPQYNGKYFRDLTDLERNRIEDCGLTLYVIKPPTSDQVIFDLFDRVNRSGTRLNNQEMRNALYQGNATKLLKNLAMSSEFKTAIGGEDLSKRMKDRYMILRFFAFYLWQCNLSIDVDTDEQLEYKSNLEDFLSKSMKYINHLTPQEIEEMQLETHFKQTMDACRQILGPNCFRLPSTQTPNRRPLNMGLFETVSFYIQNLSAYWTTAPEKILSEFQGLLTNNGYIDSITRSVDSKRQIGRRFDFINQAIEKVKS